MAKELTRRNIYTETENEARAWADKQTNLRQLHFRNSFPYILEKYIIYLKEKGEMK